MSGHWTLLRQPEIMMGSPESLKVLIFSFKKSQVNIMILGEGAGLIIHFFRFSVNPRQ